jgi:hypothetical protein
MGFWKFWPIYNAAAAAANEASMNPLKTLVVEAKESRLERNLTCHRDSFTKLWLLICTAAR